MPESTSLAKDETIVSLALATVEYLVRDKDDEKESSKHSQSKSSKSARPHSPIAEPDTEHVYASDEAVRGAKSDVLEHSEREASGSRSAASGSSRPKYEQREQHKGADESFMGEAEYAREH
ncbi:hypothetical protein LTR36_008379 [Oleoguttula mirabilis]|uniref:Uncharacterized protein n=1 Tax=Oleoguttula mirabilis TaxID=1507867 RepID=A0AAV9J8D0_9PEZI|nr:hypothetical protein LTR36_008379 [Oleoguttula mirabilis]